MIAPRSAFTSQPSDPPSSDLPLLVEDIFGVGGHLVDALGLEHRPQQEAMASHWAHALASGEPLLCEAGTGVGKSLAYLIPGLLHARAHKRPLVVSTHTISLQEQLQDKDLPICRKLFAAVDELKPHADFKAAVLVGKANYLCTTRLGRLLAQKATLFPESQERDIQRLVDWAMETKTGLVQELNPPVPAELWDAVNADSATCSKKNCTDGSCFYRRAKKAVEEADLIIVNHSLLFALLGAGFSPRGKTPGVLFPNDFVVLDEAQTVPAVATDHFGDFLSKVGLDRLCKRLYNPRNQRGLLRKLGQNRDCEHVSQTLRIAEKFFAEVRQRHLTKNATVRLYEPGWASADLVPPLEALAQILAQRAQQQEEGPDQDDLRDAKARVAGAAAALKGLLDLTAEDEVYWVERTGRAGQNVSLRSAPIDVAPYLREKLFERETSVLLTSATLADGPTMEGFAAKVGAEGVRSVIETSPFDFARNMRVRIARSAPDVGPLGKLNLNWLTANVRDAIDDVPGGSLVLFTSYADLHGVARGLRNFCEANGRPLFVQGEDGSRSDLTRRFAEAGRGVLCGTDSFWTGVDVPGPALSQVILTRLPFENPRDPVAEARAEAVQRAGGVPFYAITLPEAVIKFRQGIGRLIRTATDAGTITILDPRLLKKPYGQRFLDALPVHEWEGI